MLSIRYVWFILQLFNCYNSAFKNLTNPYPKSSHLTNAFQNDNCWPEESKMKDWKFQINVAIVTYTISQWFATCLTAPIFSVCALWLYTISISISNQYITDMSNWVKRKKVALKVQQHVTDIPITFWDILQPITGKIQSNMESICLI